MQNNIDITDLQNRKELDCRFHRLYKDSTLFAIHLDGFTHSVFYKDSKGAKHIDCYSGYAPEQYQEPTECYNARGDVAIKSFNLDRTKVLFMGFSHHDFQHNAKEFTFKSVSEWNSDGKAVNA